MPRHNLTILRYKNTVSRHNLTILRHKNTIPARRGYDFRITTIFNQSTQAARSWVSDPECNIL